jgi:hypothetical protein
MYKSHEAEVVERSAYNADVSEATRKLSVEIGDVPFLSERAKSKRRASEDIPPSRPVHKWQPRVTDAMSEAQGRFPPITVPEFAKTFEDLFSLISPKLFGNEAEEHECVYKRMVVHYLQRLFHEYTLQSFIGQSVPV